MRLISLFIVLKYEAPHPKFSHAFWIGNYRKMDWREPEMILKVGEWSRYISQLWASSDTSHWGLFATIPEFFFGSYYFWINSLPIWILIWIHYYLLNGTGWDWHLNNSFWIQNIPDVAINNINIWFLTHNTLSDQEKLDLIVLLIA